MNVANNRMGSHPIVFVASEKRVKAWSKQSNLFPWDYAHVLRGESAEKEVCSSEELKLGPVPRRQSTFVGGNGKGMFGERSLWEERTFYP